MEADDWITAAPKIQAKVNARENKSIGKSPFFTLYGFQPKLSSSELAHAIHIYSNPDKRFYQAVEKLTKAKYDHIVQANTHRREAPNYRINNQVIVSTENLPAGFHQSKLAPKWIVRFKIIDFTRKAKMSNLTYQSYLTYNTLPITYTHLSYRHISLIMMRNVQKNIVQT